MPCLALASMLEPVAEHGMLEPVVETPYGRVRGFALNGTKVWRGIPYAAAPINDLRLRPPQALQSWNITLDSKEFGASCMQWGSPGTMQGRGWNSINVTHSSENCLFVNVYVPDGVSKSLPVMVYLHAGQFVFGSSNDLESNWPYFLNGHTILVTANYRLGFFGFAASETLRSRDPSGSSGNYGMQDQRAVLKWVKQSIASFGGDAQKITIFGESSGGTSVAFHLVSKAAQGLFSQVILQSPGLTQSKSWNDSVKNTQWAVSMLTAAGSEGCTWPPKTQWIHVPGIQAFGNPIVTCHRSEALKQCAMLPNCSTIQFRNDSTTAFLYGGGAPGQLVWSRVSFANMTLRVGHNPGLDVFVRTPNPHTLAQCLMNANAVDLVVLDAPPPHGDTFLTDSIAPTVDGVELIAPIEDQMDASVPSNISMLAGSNLDEGTDFMGLVPMIRCDATPDDFAEWAGKMYGANVGAKVIQSYKTLEQPTPFCSGPASENTSLGWLAAMRSAGDNAILCPTRRLLKATQKQKGSNTWWYYFSHTPISSINVDGDMKYEGAFHGAEVPFVFGNPSELGSDAERILSKAMGCYWTNFAATGNPNEGLSGCFAELSLPKWPVFGQGDALEFGTGILHNRTSLKQAQCELFAALPPPDVVAMPAVLLV